MSIDIEAKSTNRTKQSRRIFLDIAKRFIVYGWKLKSYYENKTIKQLVKISLLTFLVLILSFILVNLYSHWSVLLINYSAIIISVTSFMFLYFRLIDYINLKILNFNSREISRHARHFSRVNLYDYRKNFINSIDKEEFISKETNFKKDIFIIEQLAINHTLHELSFALESLERKALEYRNYAKAFSSLVKLIGFGAISAIIISFIDISKPSADIKTISNIEHLFLRFFFIIVACIFVIFILCLYVEHREKRAYRIYFKEAIRIKKANNRKPDF